MADFDIGANNLGRTVLAKPTDQTVSTVNYSVFQDISTMKTYLTTHGYSADDLAKMTFNDMVYAARQHMGITS